MGRAVGGVTIPVKGGFSFYLANFARYGVVYGSLATVVAFLVFLFLAANVMVLGAEAASECEVPVPEARMRARPSATLTA